MSTTGKILVVDDHVDLAENIADILGSVGHTAVVAHSAEEALERLAGDRDIVAVITDFRLPGASGADLIAELRRRGSDLPAVVMSAYTDDETIATSQQAGAFEVLPKPVEIGRLMSLVEVLGSNDAVVLVVDDNKALAENIAEALRSRGWEAIVGGSGSEALAALARPRAAIVDYRLPDTSGVDVAERLAARDPRIRIIFVSAYPDELRGRLGGKLAEAPTLEKPVNVPQLLAWVASALGHGNAGRPDR